MRFHVLESDGLRFNTRWAYGLTADPVDVGPAPTCPVCGAFTGLLRWRPPHRITVSSAKPTKWGDLLWGAGFNFLVSDRFVAAYHAHNLKGISTFFEPATIVRIGKLRMGDFPVPLPSYRLVEVEWNGANLDDMGSGAVRKSDACSYHRGSVRSIHHVELEIATWTGADIFEVRGLPGQVLVSDRFKRMVEEAALTSLRLIPAERYAYDESRPGLWYVRE